METTMESAMTESIMLATQAARGTAAEFEAMYASAEGNPALIPWAELRPHPALVNWLNAVAPSIVRCGARVAVVGCGLGDDARELSKRGYEVTAFDCSPTAIEWAKRIDPGQAAIFTVADLFDAPGRWRRRFDLVVEVNTIQSLPPRKRAEAMRAIAEMLAAHGLLLVVCQAAEAPVGADEGPPWPLTRAELESAAASAGLAPADPVCSFEDAEGVPLMRALLRRVARV
jgi:SAM-dependent methyltransferase